MILSSEQFLNEVEKQELKHLVFFERERGTYDDNNGNFSIISVNSKKDFADHLQRLREFVERYENQTFICKASKFKNGKNFKLYTVQFRGEQQVENNGKEVEEVSELPEEVKEKLKKLEELEQRNNSREGVLNLFIDTIFDKFAVKIENLIFENLNVKNPISMNGEETKVINGTESAEQIEHALRVIYDVLGDELTITVAKKLAESPKKYKMLIKNFI